MYREGEREQQLERFSMCHPTDQSLLLFPYAFTSLLLLLLSLLLSRNCRQYMRNLISSRSCNLESIQVNHKLQHHRSIYTNFLVPPRHLACHCYRYVQISHIFSHSFHFKLGWVAEEIPKTVGFTPLSPDILIHVLVYAFSVISLWAAMDSQNKILLGINIIKNHLCVILDAGENIK